MQYNGAKGVVLATGDIGGNQEMIDAFCSHRRTALMPILLRTRRAATPATAYLMGMLDRRRPCPKSDGSSR